MAEQLSDDALHVGNVLRVGDNATEEAKDGRGRMLNRTVYGLTA